jgi:MoxR-like ATPase
MADTPNPARETPAIAPRIATTDDLEAVKALNAAYKKMTEQLARVIVGQNEVIEQVLVAIFCRGHALLVGVPGLAKTLLVSTTSRLLHLSFKRIQFTPDLMPSDITGTDVLEEDRTTGRRVFRFVHGPLFANMILADEINRTPPKTQVRCWRRCRSTTSPWARRRCTCRSRSSCWPRRTPSSRKERTRCRRRSSTASCS